MDKLLVHGYCWGTAFWYASRAACRIYDPVMVIGWFRPPSQRHFTPNDLEIYNVYNDAFCLATLAGTLMVLSSSFANADIRKPAVKALVGVTMLHHMATAYGAWDFYKRDSHYNFAMGIGVWVNVFLTAVGLVVVGGMGGEQRGKGKVS